MFRFPSFAAGRAAWALRRWPLLGPLAAAVSLLHAQVPGRPGARLLQTWSKGLLNVDRTSALGVPWQTQALRTRPAAPPAPGRVPSRGQAFRAAPGPVRSPRPAPGASLAIQFSVPRLRSCETCVVSAPFAGGCRTPWRWALEDSQGGTLSGVDPGPVQYTAPFVSRPTTVQFRAISTLDGRLLGRAALEVHPHAVLAVLDPGSWTGPVAVPVLEPVAGSAAPGTGKGGSELPTRPARPHGIAFLPATRQWLVSYPGNRGCGSGQGEPEAADGQDGGEGEQLSCPTHLAGNGQPGAAWRCAFAETGQDRIRTVDARGVVTHLAGMGTAQDPAAGGQHRDGKAEQARFSAPEGVAMEPGGTVYVADVGNRCLRRIRNGVVSTLGPQLHNPARLVWREREGGCEQAFPVGLNGGLALDSGQGILYVGVGHSVTALALTGDRRGEARTILGHPSRPGFEAWREDPPASLAGVPCLFWPKHLCFHRGQLYLSDHGNHAIRVFDPSTGALRTLAGDPGQTLTRGGPLRGGSPHLPPEACAGLAYPLGLAFDDEGGEGRVATRDGVVALRGLEPAPGDPPKPPGPASSLPVFPGT